jgi:hypothetical protein
VGRQPIVRVATRFINRIDIPNNQYNAARTKDFVTFGASVPAQIAESVTAHFATANFTIENGIKLVVQSGPINPVLLDHSSILLDIDAAIDADIPTRIDDMWEKTEILRTAKNRVFESSITDLCLPFKTAFARYRRLVRDWLATMTLVDWSVPIGASSTLTIFFPAFSTHSQRTSFCKPMGAEH